MTKRNPIYNNENIIIDSYPFYVKDGTLYKNTKNIKLDIQKELEILHQKS